MACVSIGSYADTSQLAPAYNPLQFSAPKPETYTLPVLGLAANGHVLDSDGNATTLYDLMGGTKTPSKIILLSFIYTTCSDVNGCPLATLVLHKIKARLQQEPELAAKLRLLTLSFNPQHDTPEQMKHYGQSLQGGNIEWHFLTTGSEQDLQPILKGYQQNIEKVYDAKGGDTGTFSHVLRIYLIDSQKRLRSSYTVSFLHPDTLINDIKSLLHDQAPVAPVTHHKTVDILKTLRQPPLGLPSVPIPTDNPMSEAKIALGRKLFYDRRLSLNNTQSCAMCHIPEQGFTNNEMATAVGIEGRTVRRNSPTLYNVAYATRLFHDGRESQLEQQVWLPLLSHDEMANPSIGYVVDKINNSVDYNGLFQKIFHRPASMETIGMALASYERVLNSANSAFDRWYYGHDAKALDAKAQRGFKLFTGKAGCNHCHSLNSDYALFTDNGLHNTGIGYNQAMSQTPDKQRVQLAPGVFVDVASSLINTVSAVKANDLGRYEITQQPQDRWKYKTPSLRNISLTAPYMHDGSLASLREVIAFYDQGGIVNENLDPVLKPLHLNQVERDELEYFLMILVGDNVEDLIRDARTTSIGDNQ